MLRNPQVLQRQRGGCNGASIAEIKNRHVHLHLEEI